MSTQVQFRRGNSTQTSAFTGAEAEVTINTTNKSAVVHDGVTAGGFEVARTDLVNIENATFLAKAEAAGVTGGGGGGAITATISGVTQANPGVVTTTAAHEFSNGQLVTFTDVGGMTELNGAAHFCDVLTSTTFALYTDPALTVPLNTTGFGAYTSGGTVVATTAPGAPVTSSYVVISADPVLANERTLTASSGIVLADGGPGGGATLSANLANTVPVNLGSAAAGVANSISRSDHVHAMPTAQDTGAVPVARTIIAGTGLSGGGALTGNVTLNLNAGIGSLTNVTLGNVVNGDVLLFNGATSQFENSQNLPRITTQSANANVGTVNAVKTLNFIGNAVTAGQVLITADVDPTKVNISIPEIFTGSRVRDIVGNMVTGSTQTGIAVSYDSPGGKINFATNNFNITLTGDLQGSGTVSNLGNVTINTQIAANAVILGPDTSGNYVASIASSNAAGVANTIIITNTVGTAEGAQHTLALNTSSADYIESVQDIAAGLIDVNTGTRGITAVYDDTAGKTALIANPFSVTLAGAMTGTATVANLGNVTISTVIADDSVALGTKTTGNYVASIASSNAAGVANTIIITNTVGTAEGAQNTLALNTSSADYIESVQDIAAGILDVNTGTRGITAVYDDPAGKTTLIARPFSVTLAGDIVGTATVANLGNATINTQIANDSVALGTKTTGNYVQRVSVTGSGLSVTPSTAGEGSNVVVTLASATTNSPSTVVLRDASGNFAAGTITASLTGLASLNLPLSGGTLTGLLTLSGAPTANLHAATKSYVDSSISSAGFTLNTSADSGSGSVPSGSALRITGGTGVSTVASANTITINNNGVTTLSAGSGISLSAATGAVTISATGTVAGVSAVNSQSGSVTVQGTAGKIEVDTPASGIIRIGIPNDLTLTTLSTGSATATGNITGGNLIATAAVSAATVVATTAVSSPSVVKTGLNGVGNIGQSTNAYNTVFARATSAQYADLAESYLADTDYEPGTVVCFGGDFEVTVTDLDSDTAVAGIVSTAPAYEMNAALTGDHVCKVGLTGRLPCRVKGSVRKGSLLVSAGGGYARAEIAPLPGTIVGKSLENFDGVSGIIEVVVGRF